MVGKVFRGLSEIQEQSVGVFALIIVELCHCPGVQKLVAKPAAVFPQVSVSHRRDIPGTEVDAQSQL